MPRSAYRKAAPATFGALLTFSLLVGGCIEDKFTSLYVVNDTGNVISVSYEHAGGRVLADRITPGGVATIENPFADTGDCADGALVAHWLDGSEVARRTTKICIGDTWRVESASPAPSASAR